MDEAFLHCYPEVAKTSGAVLTTCLIVGKMLYCVNLGDCRAVIFRDGKALNLSVDHKATLPTEVERIKKLGGFVYGGRIFGRLAVSRAIGDYDLKKQKDENN